MSVGKIQAALLFSPFRFIIQKVKSLDEPVLLGGFTAAFILFNCLLTYY